MTTPDRLVTLDNNILIDLREHNELTTPYARQLLEFNREGKITVATTLSTLLEKQRTGEEMTIQEQIAWLRELGFTDEHIFMEPRTVTFNVQGVTTWSIEREIALNRCIHAALFPTIPFDWREYLDQQCVKLGIVGRRRAALFELDIKKPPYIPSSPQAPQERPTPTLDALEQIELEELSETYLKWHWYWMNKKNDALGLYNHLTNASNTTYPDQSIFVTADNHFLNKTTTIRQCGGFRGEIFRLADAVAFIEKVTV